MILIILSTKYFLRCDIPLSFRGRWRAGGPQAPEYGPVWPGLYRAKTHRNALRTRLVDDLIGPED